MLNFNLLQITEICQGQSQGENVQVMHVAIDSRKVEKNSLFVAFKGEHVDGHDYLAQAKQMGASAALVEHFIAVDLPQIKVADAATALALLARAYRDNYSGQVIAITGSSGKTSTKAMLHCILAQSGKVSATQGNLNNELGVPLTLLSADLNADYWIVEMGAAQQGDIQYLMGIAKPNISVITNIGNAHIGRFGSVEAIAQAKGEIYEGLTQAGTAVINADDAFAARWMHSNKLKSVHYSLHDHQASLFVSDVSLQEESSTFVLHYQQQTINILLAVAGEHNIYNALCASACALAAGANLAHIQQGLSHFTPVDGRLQSEKIAGDIFLIDDSYNANPASVKAAINVLSAYAARKILVLGDMGELGEQAEFYHRMIGQYAKQQGIDLLVAKGEFTAYSVQDFGAGAVHFSTHQAVTDYLRKTLKATDVVLIKGSRSQTMERVIQQLKQKASA